MGRIHLTTFIAAPVERVFDLTRHVALYRFLFNSRQELFSSGGSTNLLDQGETISINVKHAGKTRMSMLKIASLKKPVHYIEEQWKGDLEHFRHEHHFKPTDNGTILINLIDFGLPKDIIGRLLGKFYLRTYLEELVQARSELIRRYAETDKWRAVLL